MHYLQESTRKIKYGPDPPTLEALPTPVRLNLMCGATKTLYICEIDMKLKLTIGIISGMLLTLINAHSLTAQGADFGTNRQPRTCASRSAPIKGRISAAQAAIYVACDAENESMRLSGSINFIDILSLEVAPKPRRVNGNDLSYFSQVDTSQPAYDLRGNVVSYTCYNVSIRPYKAGSNCSVRRIPQSRGTCLKNTFGEWFCSIDRYSQTVETKMPAPN